MIYSVSRLQREFGLPFHVAEAIIRGQMALAQQHYRRWYMPVWIGIVTVLVCNFAPVNSLLFHAGHFILPVLCVYLGIVQYLTYRRARTPILAAARAATHAS